MKLSINSFHSDFKAFAEAHPEKIAIILEKDNSTYTYGQILDLVHRTISLLHRSGLQKGENILSLLPNSVEKTILFLSCCYAGYGFAPYMENAPRNEIESFIDLTKPKHVFTTDTVRGETSNLLENQYDFAPTQLRIDQSFSWLKKEEPISVETGCGRLFLLTSGSTGAPKAMSINSDVLWTSGQTFTKLYPSILNQETRFWNYLSMTYLGGLFNLCLIPLAAGGSFVLSDNFSPTLGYQFWKKVNEFQINSLWLVPSIARLLLKLSKRSNQQQNLAFAENVRGAFLGTAPIDLHTKKEFEEVFNLQLLENYGLSETTFLSAELLANDGTLRSPHSESQVGQVLPHIDLKLVTSNETDPEAPKEVWIKSPFLFEGYVGSDGETKLPLDDEGYFATGDLARIDNNSLVLDGRIRDVIKKGGYFIRLREVEALSEKHPQIEEAIAVKHDHEFYGEAYTLFLRADETTEENDLKTAFAEWLDNNLSHHKRPEEIFIVPDFPRTSSGKVRKHIMADFKGYFEKKSQLRNPPAMEVSKIVASIPQALSIKINQAVYNLQRQGGDVTTLSLGEAFFDIPQFDFSELNFEKGYHYSDSAGIPELREKIASFYQKEYKAPVFSDEIVVSAGSKPLTYMAMQAVLNPGDEVLIPEPAWLSYEEQVKLCQGTTRFISFDTPISDYHKHITDRTKLLILNNPNNPSGYLYSAEELGIIYEQCRSRGVYLMVDEAYSDFLLEGGQFNSIATVVPDKDGVIVVNSLSKNMGISGWRIGYAIASKPIRKSLLKLNQHLITCAPSILVQYVNHYFDRIIGCTLPQVRELMIKRQRVERMLSDLDLACLPGHGSFYFFISADAFEGDVYDLALYLLLEHHIALVPGVAYGASTSRYLRLSFGAEPDEKIFEALKTLKQALSLKGEDYSIFHEKLEQLLSE
ncbi:aminotransferase class I/II-fold pyridoxal phosphate-dependent enzyme [Kiloniella litopenaei]|uniref:aminotransferase class I/II-fold pyridoxal phosphate-dependent enzyme n=1 Tax=Kiloniella litopenaei TaxID=1549748 RepID=UPI003BA88953